jgi:hypothetical protein
MLAKSLYSAPESRHSREKYGDVIIQITMFYVFTTQPNEDSTGRLPALGYKANIFSLVTHADSYPGPF